MQSKFRNGSKDCLEHHHNLTEEQLQEFYPELRRYCQFITQNIWDGEEVVQESLIKAWLHYQNQPNISMALLNRIARNEWIDTVRKRNKGSLEAFTEYIYDESKQIENRLEAIHNLVNKLSPKQAVMFALKEGFRFQLTEIAEIFNTTETAVKAVIYRAKQRLKKGANDTNPLIEQYWEMEDYEQIERILNESFKTQDPSILIRSIPFIHSLRKEISYTSSMHKLRLFKSPSSTIYMAA
ncbi:sigma-70 family RNA polymerase sigma factor [Aneurinibacillus tyrosinisolvens]|uniref:sigma-70 family RNA polymerase sigma factor n=1 Tax=Aneurinibacillus tyrosinisolvens TaxID=1443435 RepID=UPI00063F594C|nr:sigma-70 family RNA polymerase sigma factor [Aneurinibacillus tyrosinisolvens]